MKQFYSVLFFLCFAYLASGQTENFNGAVGPIDTMTTNNGFGGPWKFLNGYTQVSISAGGLTIDSLALKSSGNKLQMNHPANGAACRFFRKLATPVTDDGKVYYMSWIQNAIYDNPAANGSSCQAMLVNSATYAASGPNGQLVRMGKIFNTERFGIDGSGANGTFYANGTDTRGTFWAVAAIYMSGNTGNERIHIFINPKAGAPLDTTKSNVAFSPTLNSGFDAIGIKNEGTASINAFIDDLRFGTSFEAVTPTDLISVTVAAFEKMSYNIADSLNGQNGGAGFAKAWEFKSGNSQATIVNKGIDITALDLATSTNHLSVIHNAGAANVRFQRVLKNPVTDDGGLYYFSWAQDADYDAPATNGSVAQFMIIKSAGFAATGAGGQAVRIGKLFNTNLIGIDGQRVVGTPTIPATESANPFWAVGVLKMSGNTDREMLYIFINPIIPTTGLDTTKANFKVSVDLNDGFDAIGAKVEGAQKVDAKFDELRFGLKLADVVPTDLTKIVQPNTIIAFDKFGSDGGWAGGWRDLANNRTATIASKGLINDVLLLRTTPNSWKQKSIVAANRYVRYFSKALDTVNNKTFWFSAHLGSVGAPANTAAGLLFVDSTKVGDNIQHVIIGKQFNVSNIFAAGNGQVGAVTQTGRNFNSTTANWIVGYMSYEGGQWLMDLWVDPPTNAEPNEANAQIKNKPYARANLHGVGLRAEGGIGADLEADDIIIGQVWKDIVPLDLATIVARPVVSRDKFDYAANTSIIGATGGTGYSTPYTLLSGKPLTTAQGGISSFKLLRRTSTNRLQGKVGEASRIVRTLAPGYGDNGRDYWIGWFFNAPNGGNNVAHLVLADTATYRATGAEGQLVQIGQVFGGGIGTVPGGKIGDIKSNEGHFIVAQISTNGSAANDSIFVWVDPDLTRTPSRDSAFKLAANLSRWNAIGYKVEYAPDSLVTPTWDDVALGFSYTDVVPSDLTPVEAPVFAEVVYEGFDYANNADIKDQNGGRGWSNKWTQASAKGGGLVTTASIVSDRVNATGNKLTVTQSNSDSVRYTRAFKAPFAKEGDAVIWGSMVVNVETKDVGNLFIANYVDGRGNALFDMGGLQGISKFGFQKGDAQKFDDLNLVGAKWIVTRFDIKENGPDRIHVWLNPLADAIPVLSTANYTLETNIVDGVAALNFLASGFQNTKANVDEIRMGFSFRDVSSKFGSSDSNLLAYEPFNYDVNTTVIGSGGENAFFNNAWFDKGQASATNRQVITNGSLVYPGTSSIGNKARFELREENKQIRVDRNLSTLLQSDGKVYWFSFLMNSDSATVRNQIAQLTLRSSSITNNDGQVITFGRIYGTGNLGLVTPQNATTTVTTRPDKGLNYIVVRVKTVANAAVLDTVHMWINPSLASEPDTAKADIKQRATNAFKQAIDVMRLRVEGAGADQIPYTTEFDEIRIATAWPSVRLTTNTIEALLGDKFELTAYPNPTIGLIQFDYTLEQSALLNMSMYNVKGQVVKVLINERKDAGKHTLSSDVSDLDNGIYFVKIADGKGTSVRKIILYR